MSPTITTKSPEPNHGSPTTSDRGTTDQSGPFVDRFMQTTINLAETALELATFDVATPVFASFRKQAPGSPAPSQTQVESKELAKQYTPWVVLTRVRDLAWAECGSDLVKRGLTVIAGAVLPYFIAVKSSALADLLKQPPPDPIAAETMLYTHLVHIAVGTGLLLANNLAASRLTSRFCLQMSKALTRGLTDVPHLNQEDVESEKTKKLVSSVTWTRNEVVGFIQGFFSTTKDAVSCVFGLAVLGWQAPWAAVVMAGVGATFSLTKMRAAIDMVATSDATNDTRQRHQVRQWYSTFADAIRQIKLLGKVQLFAEKVIEPLEDVTKQDLALADRDAKRNAYVGSISFFADIVIVATLSVQTMLSNLGMPSGIKFEVFVTACATLTLVRVSLEQLRESLGEQMRRGIFARRFLMLTDLAKEAKAEKEASLTELPFDPNHPPRIEFRGVSYSHPRTKTDGDSHDSGIATKEGSRRALNNVSLSFEPGELIVICGDTGSGKTTLFDLLAKVRKPESGGVYVQGHDLRTIPVQLWTNFISIHVQNFQLFQSLTLSENASMGASSHSQIEFDEAATLVGADFIREKGLTADATWGADFQGGVFASGGQQQQLALLRTASKEPRVLIVDEPTSALGPKETRNYIQYIKNVHLSGATVIISAHNYNLIRSLAPDRIIVMRGGELEIHGTHDELMKTPNSYSNNFRTFQGESANGG